MLFFVLPHVCIFVFLFSRNVQLELCFCDCDFSSLEKDPDKINYFTPLFFAVCSHTNCSVFASFVANRFLFFFFYFHLMVLVQNFCLLRCLFALFFSLRLSGSFRLVSRFDGFDAASSSSSAFIFVFLFSASFTVIKSFIHISIDFLLPRRADGAHQMKKKQ